jgi:hypothetical protein
MNGANPLPSAAQIPVKKVRWATRARRRITIISKGAGEIFAALAEPLMRYATIYLALATSIPALNWGPLYATALGVVIIAPEFVLLGALSIAEQAIKSGQTKWGRALYVVSFLLAAIMVATFVDIFIYTFPDLALKCLNFARCLIAVSFSLVLGKLDKESDEPDVMRVAPPTPDEIGQAFDRLKVDLSKQIEEGLQQIRVEVQTHHHVIEEDTTATQGHLLSVGNRTTAQIEATQERTIAAPTRGQEHVSERTAASEPPSHEPDNEPERTADKLELTLDFLRENPQRANSPEIDTLLAAHLGLKRPASARFWRLKAQELLTAAEQEETSANEQGAYSRLLTYVQRHPPATQKAIAAHLSMSERTVRRHLAAMRKSGQLPVAWTAESGQDTDEKAAIDAAMSSLEKRPDAMRTEVMSSSENDLAEDNQTPDNGLPLLRVVK